VFDHLQIYNRRERLLVGAADVLLAGYGIVSRTFTRREPDRPPERVLLLRLERIGDLLMTLGAIDEVRARAPKAAIHLVIGSWNAALAPLITSVDTHETLDVPWLVRGARGSSRTELIARARAWRRQRFDLGINFEPDIRTNYLLALSHARRRIGFSSGGGGAFLTDALVYEPARHTADNALRTVERAIPSVGNRDVQRRADLRVPESARRDALALLGGVNGREVLVGIHPSGGRLIKQWHMERFAEVAERLARDLSATIVLTGTPDDRPLVERIVSLLPPDVRRLDITGRMDLQLLAAVLERLNLFVTADTGPMHLAAAVGTPTVALFGPSDPKRYGPLNDRARVVTADLWCRPCNRVRRPPERCVGRVPDCLDRIEAEDVYRAASGVVRTSS
jgi:ADP-heptose:LPS heptosyltransferase